MKWSGLPLNPTARALRQFAAVWLALFATLAWRALAHGHRAAGLALAVAALPALAGLVKPRVVRWLFIVATVAAFPVGWAATQAALAVLFYLVLTPVALLFRWRGRDLLQLRRRSERASYWIERGEAPKPERYLKPF
ncbi:MAG: hypothetical protein KGJ60_03975 [Verrucomicrobiota bacterium]|nr:hypothetical protein [Verrucomicrobiota bacterium]